MIGKRSTIKLDFMDSTAHKRMPSSHGSGNKYEGRFGDELLENIFIKRE